MSAEFRAEGFRQLRDNAARLEKKLQMKVFRAAVRAGGKVAVDAAKAKVPVRTGSVKASLVHRANSKPSRGLYGVKVSIKGGRRSSERVARRRNGRGGTYHPDDVARYYRFTELGTKYHPAKPYLAPALEDSQTAILAAVKETLAAGIERESRSL